MRPEAVVFDIGNVLIEWLPEQFFDRLIGIEKRKALFDAVDLNEMNEQVDRGAAFRETVLTKAEEFPEWAAEIKVWHDRWIEIAAPEIPHSIRLLRALRHKNIPVFSLSNFGVDTFEIACGTYPFLKEFDRQFISGHLQVTKPDPRIYEILERDTGVAPGALMFADDRADNIDMAAQRGWQTHLFKGPQGWADKLVASGLLSQEEAQ